MKPLSTWKRSRASLRRAVSPARSRSGLAAVPWRGLGIAALVASIPALMGYLVVQRLAGSPESGSSAETVNAIEGPGVFVESQGGRHLGTGVVWPVCSAGEGEPSHCYGSNPPTSGPMDNQTVKWGIYSTPVPKERLVHNMEHGGVVIWYNCATTACSRDVVPQLERLMDHFEGERHLVVMTPYPGMEPDTVAVTAWTRLDSFPAAEFVPERVHEFVDRFERRYNPEGAPPL